MGSVSIALVKLNGSVEARVRTEAVSYCVLPVVSACFGIGAVVAQRKVFFGGGGDGSCAY